MLSTPEAYDELLHEVTNALQKEITRERAVVYEKTWGHQDHVPENSIIVSGFDNKMNTYILYALMSTAGTVKKMWFGFKKIEKYYNGSIYEIGKLRKKIAKTKVKLLYLIIIIESCGRVHGA